MHVTWPLVVVLSIATSVAYGHSVGAPLRSCDNMIPAHRTGTNQISAQRSPLPYKFQLSKFTYSPGEQITMTLSGGQAGYMKGFLVKVIDKRGVAVGTMTAPGGLQTITCGFNGNEALTHTEPSQKPAVRFGWTAPSDLSGPLSVRATVVRSYGIFWANELIATLQPAPSVRPQITTVSPPVTTGPELTSILPDTTKQPELITHSKVISTETLTKVSDVSVIGNATTVVVGKDSTLINNETTNISLGVGKLSIEEKASYSMTNISYNDNNTSNLIHDIAASLMLSKISNLADDYFAFTKPLDNETIGNISEAQPAADLEATFLSVLDVKTNDQDSVNENDKALLSSESKNKTNGTRTANTLQDLNSTTLNESSTQPVEVDTRLFSTYHSHKQQSTVLSKTTFNTDTTTKGMTDFATSRIPPIPDHTIHTNTISSKTFHPLSSDFYSNQSTDSVNHTLVTTFPTTSLFDVLRSNKTLFTTRTPSQTISTIEDNVTQLKTTISNVAEKANTAVNQITALPTETPKMVSSTSYLNLLNHTDETESNTTNTSIIANKHKQSTSEKNVIDTTEADLKETTKTINHTVSDSKAYTDAGLQTTRDVTSVATVNLEDITKASISETTLPKVTDDLDHNKLISTLTAVTEDIPKVKEVTTLPVVVDTEDKIVATSTADMGNIITKDTLPFTYETTTALESTTTETHSSTRFSTELTTVTTLPPIIARTFPVRKPKVRPRTNDVWLKMNPGPVTVNNLFKLMPTTKRVWLKVEPTVRPPVFVQPAFKAPRLPVVTSTTKTTRATTTTEPRVKVVPAVLQDGMIEYDPACGSSKGCFVDCTNDGCKFMVTWEDVGYGVRFELFGKTKHSDSWIAVGFSKDTRMSDDSVVECIHSGGIVQAFNSYNPTTVMNNNRLTTHATTGLSEVSGSYYDGVFRCRFTRAYRVDAERRIFDLQKDWNIMFAHGSLAFGSVAKNMHTEMPAASASRVDYQSVVVIGKAAKFTLVKVHGCMMILSWVLFCGVGICVARYYKNVWSDKTFLKLKIWFQVHRACMVTALVLDLIAFIIIFVDVKGYSQIPDIPGKSYLKSHPVLGIIVTLLCVANPIMALFRPGPADSKRPIFNWAHWGVGISAYILSALTICFGFELGKASTPDYAVYIMIGYIVYIVLFDIACEVHDFLTKKEKKGKADAMEMGNHNGTDNGLPNGNSSNYTTKEKKKKSDKLKTVLLAFHIAFTGAFALVLVLVVALN